MEPEEIVLRITDKLDAGFGELHKKVDVLRTDFTTHRESCFIKFNVLETDMEIRKAANVLEREQAREKRDWWKWIVRGVTGAAAFSLMAIAWKILTGAVRIVEVMK